MSPKRWILLAALVAALVPLQHFVLEKTPEKLEENVYTNIADLPPGDMVPTYVGSLFLGSFRAVAIDVFWIQLKDAQESRRWYQAREIAEIITKLQPHNEEVWSMLAWEFAYNVANGEAERDEEKAWQWVRYGLLKLREGIRRNPRSPYLRYELGRFLLHKPSWRTGRLDMALLQRIEGDDELQRELQDPEPVRVRRSAFELAIRWYGEARDAIQQRAAGEDLFYKTQMGLYIRPDTMDSFIRDCLFFQGMYEWRLAVGSADSPYWEKSQESFKRAAEQVRWMGDRYGMREIDRKHQEVYARMGEVLAMGRAFARDGTPAKEAYVRVMEDLLNGLGMAEHGLVYGALCPLKRELSIEWIRIGNRMRPVPDENEYNDHRDFATYLPPKVGFWGNFKPGPSDVDRFLVNVPGDPAHFEPVLVTVVASVEGELPFTIEISDSKKTKERITSKNRQRITFIADRPGSYTLEVRPDPVSTLPDDTRYLIGVAFE